MQDANFDVDILGANPGGTDTLALDNIQFTNCGRPAPTTGDCPSNQIKCKTNVCMTRYGLCDNLNDCGDNSDESDANCRKLKVAPCAFENNQDSFCNWTQEFNTGSNVLWKSMTSTTANLNANMLRMTGPTFDHTYRVMTK